MVSGPSHDVIPSLPGHWPHEGNWAALTSAAKAHGQRVCGAKTETSGWVMLCKLPVAESNFTKISSKEVLNHNSLCFDMLGCLLDWMLFFGYGMGVPCRHLCSSGGFSCLDFPIPYILRIYTAERNSEKTTLQLLIQILSQICNLCPPLPDEQWGELWLGIKMPTLHYGWSTSLQLAAWGWGSDQGQGQGWLSYSLLC